MSGVFRFRRDVRVGLILLTALLTAVAMIATTAPVAFGDDDATNQEEETTEETTRGPIRDYHDQLYDVGKRVPGFAGVWVEEETDTEVIAATDPRLEVAVAAQAALLEIVGPSIPRSNLRVVPADYTFVQLYEWYKPLRQALPAHEDVYTSTIGQKENRIIFGVEDPVRQRPLVETQLILHGVPSEAVILERSGPLVLDSSLTDRHRRVINGLRISWTHPNYSNECTLGLVARHVYKDWFGFVTNSHCSGIHGDGSDGSIYYQPTASSTNRIGREVRDRPVDATPCPSGWRCRYSDANFVLFDSTDLALRGRIARPACCNTTDWNGDIFEIHGRLTIKADELIRKVGMATGLTAGKITHPCIDVPIAGTNIRLLCQAEADYGRAGGDSGSPVFRRYSESGVHVARIAGIHAGRLIETGAAYFSRIDYIEQELGQLHICKPGIGVVC